LCAIITFNPKAIETADEVDRNYRASSSAVGPLHGISAIDGSSG
jgi:hypothetical protein